MNEFIKNDLIEEYIQLRKGGMDYSEVKELLENELSDQQVIHDLMEQIEEGYLNLYSKRRRFSFFDSDWSKYIVYAIIGSLLIYLKMSYSLFQFRNGHLDSSQIDFTNFIIYQLKIIAIALGLVFYIIRKRRIAVLKNRKGMNMSKTRWINN